MAVALALLAALAYGAADFYGGLATRRLPPGAVVLRSNLIGLPGMVVGAVVVHGTWTSRDALIGAVAGVAATTGLLLLYRALARGTMSLVAPLTAVLAAVVPMTVGLATGERPTVAAVLGLPVALVAVVLLVSKPRTGDDDGGLPVTELLAALGAGVAFGLFFVAIDATSHEAGLWPVVTSNVTSIPLLMVTAAKTGAVRARATGATPEQIRTTAWIVAACGVFGAAGHVFFLLATRQGLLTLVAVIASLYPASTLLLARIVLGERIGGLQRLGAVLAGVAVVLIGVG
jgi:uncharacterized membrane protein